MAPNDTVKLSALSRRDIGSVARRAAYDGTYKVPPVKKVVRAT